MSNDGKRQDSMQSASHQDVRPVAAAFWSYVRLVDSSDGGLLTKLRNALQAEIRLRLPTFDIFQDDDIPPGKTWMDAVGSAIDASCIFLAVVTPGFFRSEICRRELARFLERERSIGRNDMLVSILWIDTPELFDVDVCMQDPLVAAVAAHQWVDWRKLRFGQLRGPMVRKAVANLASRLCPLIQQYLAEAPGRLHPRFLETRWLERQKRTLEVKPASRGGAFSTLESASQAASPGDTIIVHPGTYRIGFQMDKQLEVRGVGQRDAVIIESNEGPALAFTADRGTVANLTLRHGGRDNSCAVDMSGGNLVLEGCDISSGTSDCIRIRRGASPRVSHCMIHDSLGTGVLVQEGGFGLIEHCEIRNHALACVQVAREAHPEFRNNRISRGSIAGIVVDAGGLGTFDQDEILDNQFANIVVHKGAQPLFCRVKIRYGRKTGVFLHSGAEGLFENCEIEFNRGRGLITQQGATTVFRGNCMRRNGS